MDEIQLKLVIYVSSLHVLLLEERQDVAALQQMICISDKATESGSSRFKGETGRLTPRLMLDTASSRKVTLY